MLVLNHGNLRGPPQCYATPPRNKALIRPYLGKPLVNSPLIRPYFLGGWHWGVPLGSHDGRYHCKFQSSLKEWSYLEVVWYKNFTMNGIQTSCVQWQYLLPTWRHLCYLCVGLSVGLKPDFGPSYHIIGYHTYCTIQYQTDTPLKSNIDTQNKHFWKKIQDIFQTITFFDIYVKFSVVYSILKSGMSDSVQFQRAAARRFPCLGWNCPRPEMLTCWLKSWCQSTCIFSQRPTTSSYNKTITKHFRYLKWRYSPI